MEDPEERPKQQQVKRAMFMCELVSEVLTTCLGDVVGSGQAAS